MRPPVHTDEKPEQVSSGDAPPSVDVEVDPRALQCRGCRYALRGLDTEGRCPECGLPIVQSMETERSRLRHLALRPWRRDRRSRRLLGGLLLYAAVNLIFVAMVPAAHDFAIATFVLFVVLGPLFGLGTTILAQIVTWGRAFCSWAMGLAVVTFFGGAVLTVIVLSAVFAAW